MPFVPLVQVHVLIETSVVERVPSYEVPLIKRAFQKRYGRQVPITATPLQDIDPTLDPYFQVGSSEQEEQRLSGRMKHRAVFASVYPGDSFHDAFAKVALDENPWPAMRDALIKRHAASQAAAGAPPKPLSDIERMNRGDDSDRHETAPTPQKRLRALKDADLDADGDSDGDLALADAPIITRKKAGRPRKPTTPVDVNDT